MNISRNTIISWQWNNPNNFLKQNEKQENGHLALLENIPCKNSFMLVVRKDLMLTNLSFLFPKCFNAQIFSTILITCVSNSTILKSLWWLNSVVFCFEDTWSSDKENNFPKNWTVFAMAAELLAFLNQPESCPGTWVTKNYR